MGILICGLNGAGKSTTGRMLARRLEYRFIDSEDLYFPKTDRSYEYSDARSKEEAVRILNERIDADNSFIFAAVKGDYGQKLISQLDYAVLIEVPREIRLERVRARSYAKFGERIFADGEVSEKENAWFSFVESRPEDYVEKWLETLPCPIIRVDGTCPVEDNVEYLASVLSCRKT